jgi:hypothetical protein
VVSRRSRKKPKRTSFSNVYPTDEILVARGKYSTLNKERREQIKRAQKIAETMQAIIYKHVATMQTGSPCDFSELQTCMDNMAKTASKLEELIKSMREIEPLAWGE